VKYLLLLGLAGATVYALVRLGSHRMNPAWEYRWCGLCGGQYTWKGWQHFDSCSMYVPTSKPGTEAG
jgi:hypothetical protein